MSAYETAIIRSVERSIKAVNDIIVLLQQEQPLRSDLIDICYPQDVVDTFLERTEAIVNHIQSASDITTQWLAETVDNISTNLVAAQTISEAIQESICSLGQIRERRQAAQECVSQLESEVDDSEDNLATAIRSLADAEKALGRRKLARTAMRLGAAATFFVAPVVSGALIIADSTKMRRSIAKKKERISFVEGVLTIAHERLEDQRTQLESERAQSAALSAHIEALQEQQEALASEVDRLQDERVGLSELSVIINDCLFTVNSALSSSATISAARSMRNVVSGIRGLVEALGEEAMFVGPVAQLNDTALAVLGRRVEVLRQHRMMI
ncbi:hypothetical protein C8Q78DRAFT_1077752 [Trametes maxima]|nr:hypothetical protein C8Q78DRAFT_1077752 [Trametes maxima]